MLQTRQTTMDAQCATDECGPDLTTILQPVRAELAIVQDMLQQGLGVDEILLREVVEHLRAGQGKHVRPALVLLGAHVGPQAQSAAVRQAAVAVELIHNATLIHDDIVDAAVMRRNQPSVNAKWGNEVSVLSGDFLYARAFHVLAKLHDPRALAIMARTGEAMSIGELAEVEYRGHWALSEAQYLEVIDGKTAVLIAAAAEIGAYLSGASTEHVAAIAAYGHALGMAFQIADDCLDLVGDARLLGKMTGSDVTRGNMSLALVYLREELSPDDQARTFGALAHTENPQRILRTVVQWARERGMVDRAYQRALAYVAQATAALAPLQSHPVCTPLTQLAAYAVRRRH